MSHRPAPTPVPLRTRQAPPGRPARPGGPRGARAATGPARRGAGVGLVVLAVATLGAAPALADPTLAAGIVFSSDGQHFGRTLPPLFTENDSLVPGEQVSRELWLRNDTAVAVHVHVVPQQPAGAGGVRFAVAGQDAVELRLAPGARDRVVVAAWLPEQAQDETQGLTLPVSLAVGAVELPPGGAEELGMSGASVGIWPLAAAVVVGGLGLLVAGARRDTPGAGR